MFKKAVSKWTIAFLSGFILTVGVILMVVVIPGLLHQELCPRAQEREIQNVWIKVEKMKGKAGYETIYFKVEDCVEEIWYDSGNITVKYVTGENVEVQYPTNTKDGWMEESGGPMHLDGPGTYYFRVFENKVERLEKVS